MNGKMIGSKPLYVAIAQRKEDRRARLQVNFYRQVLGVMNIELCKDITNDDFPSFMFLFIIIIISSSSSFSSLKVEIYNQP